MIYVTAILLDLKVIIQEKYTIYLFFYQCETGIFYIISTDNEELQTVIIKIHRL